MEPTFGLKKSNITFAKIVATPTLTSWSQAYHAGNLFAVLSLNQQEASSELNLLGKELLDTLEQEFFTLETKDLASIKQAVATTDQKIPDSVESSLVVAVIQPADQTILYIYGLGNARISLKRGEKLGTILPYCETLAASSGFLNDSDIIILETKKFAEIISHDTLLSSLDNRAPEEVSEILAPKIHETEEGEATALIISFKKSVEEVQTQEPPTPQLEQTEESSNGKTYDFSSFKKRLPAGLKQLFVQHIKLNHSKKLFLTIAVVILIVLISSIFFAIKSQQNKKTQQLFSEIYPKASQKYEQGQSLLGLNKNLARDDFESAKKILIEGKSKFKKGSTEEKQVNELLAKVDSALENASGTQTVQPQRVDLDKSPILQAYSKYPNASHVAQDEKSVYVITTSSILSIDKASTSVKTIIKNDNHWKKPGGFGTYLGNMYVLDKEIKQIFKFVSGSFAKSNYLPNANSDLSDAASLAIDGSVYVLLENGEVKKFTKGVSETFSLSGLDKPLAKPSRIFTNAHASNIYILDKGNSRIVVFAKNGTYQSQYQTDILKNAIDIEVLEKEKRIYILLQGKVYEVEL